MKKNDPLYSDNAPEPVGDLNTEPPPFPHETDPQYAKAATAANRSRSS